MKKQFLFAALLFQSTFSFAGDNGDANRHMQAGNDALNAQRYLVAWQEFEQATKLDETNVQAWQALADVCTRMNKWAPAIVATERVHQLLPNDKPAAQALLDAYVRYNQPVKAADLGRKMLKQNPATPGANFAVGKALYAQRNFGQALPFMEQAARQDNHNAEAAYLSGRMLVNMGDYPKAAAYYKAALAMEPAQPARAYEYAMLLGTIGDHAQSAAWYEKALELGQPAGDDFYLNMAYAYTDAGQSAKGIATLQSLMSRRPTDLGIVEALAEAYAAAGNQRQAVDCLEKLYEANGDARVLYRIGLAHIKMGKESKGKGLCDKAIEQDPSLASLRRQQGMF